MTDNSTKPATASKRSRAKYAAWIVAAAMLYPLSAGPVEWIVYRWGNGFKPNSSARTLFEIAYAPAEWIASRSPRSVYGIWQRYTNYFFDLAYRADNEKWLSHPSVLPLSVREPHQAGNTSASDAINPIDSADESPGPQIAGRTISEWQDFLKQIDPQANEQDETVAGLIELIKSPQAPWFTRRQAALTIGRIHVHHPENSATASAIPVLIEMLATRSSPSDFITADPAPALWAAQALALFGPAANNAAPQLIANLQDQRRPVTERLVTIEALAVIGPAHQEVIPAMIQFVESPTGEKLVSGLKAADDKTASQFDQQQLQRDERELREAIVEAFAVMGAGADPAIPVLIRNLQDSSETLRCKSAATLGILGARAEIAVPSLLELLAFDESASARDAAGDALGKIGPASIDGLARLAAQTDPQLRRRAVTAIGGVGRAARSRSDLLIPSLRDDDASVRAAAAEALWKIDPQSPDLLPALVRALADEDRQNRMRAHRILVKMGSSARGAIGPLRELLRDDRADVRRLVGQTIEKLEAVPASH